MTHRRYALSLLILVVLAPLGIRAESPPALVWIHAEANEGGASGGHAALRIGSDVYHYQTVEGRTLLVRWTWTRFRRLYNDLQNRTLHLVEHGVERAVADRVRQRFNAAYQEQRRQLARAEDLAFQRTLVDAWLSEPISPVPIRGLGLYSREVGTRGASALLGAIQAAHGIDFLPSLIARLDEELQDSPFEEADFQFEARAEWRDAAARALAFRERLELREALNVLAGRRPLDPARQLAPESERPTPAEQAWLARELQALEDRTLRLVSSSRPDRGYALLLTTARHRTIERSLADQRHYTLDPFPRGAATLAAPRRADRKRVFDAMSQRLAAEHQAFRAQLVAGRSMREPDYRALEVIAAAHFEVSRSMSRGHPIRMLRGVQTPARSGSVTPPLPSSVAPTQARLFRSTAGRAEHDYLEFLRREHGYQIVRRNCATELLRTLQSSFPSPEVATRALGGHVRPYADLHFVPFRWIDAIEDSFDRTTRTTLPSYRVRYVEAMQARHSPRWVSLRESNTWTSELYVGSPADSHFLFFTDPHLALRPFLGALNLGYALVQSTVGLASWPWDGGERIDRGLRGAVFSVPELAFMSLRKGTFEDVPRP